MPRDLMRSDRNKATFMDGPSKGEVSLYYRSPTNAERIAFKAACMIIKNGKPQDKSLEAQLYYGAKILTGIEDGDFLKDEKPISSDENSPDYDPGWKNMVLTTAGDLVEALALLAFAGVVLKYDGKDKDPGEEKGLDMSDIPGLGDSDKIFSDDAIAEVRAAQEGEEETDSPLV